MIDQKRIKSLPIYGLRNLWRECWGKSPPPRMGRTMLEKSIQYKQRETILTDEQYKKLDRLIAQYRSNPKCFDQGRILKPGTRLVREYNNKKHIVTVQENGFEYRGRNWSSLSKIASEITGTAWNGWKFFAIK